MHRIFDNFRIRHSVSIETVRYYFQGAHNLNSSSFQFFRLIIHEWIILNSYKVLGNPPKINDRCIFLLICWALSILKATHEWKRLRKLPLIMLSMLEPIELKIWPAEFKFCHIIIQYPNFLELPIYNFQVTYYIAPLVEGVHLLVWLV